jgi:hypothetical protein
LAVVTLIIASVAFGLTAGINYAVWFGPPSMASPSAWVAGLVFLAPTAVLSIILAAVDLLITLIVCEGACHALLAITIVLDVFTLTIWAMPFLLR